MNVAIMQPYLFPYLGYFQLISAADVFVVYDDVNFIKGGWINRNHILSNSKRQLITLPLQGASQNKLINQVEIGGVHKLLKSLRQSYGKAPHFDVVYPLLEDIFGQAEGNLSRFLYYQLQRVCEQLGLRPQWHISSEPPKGSGLRGQDRILSICEELGATRYINLIGGRALYDVPSFTSRGLELSFIQPRTVCYRQLGSGFVPNLSIIDVMMFNDRQQCASLLEEYDFV